jgi:crotonobetainyl-CoA:carnitine CoA-transferase CaiB-like acyl-CoA transferase
MTLNLKSETGRRIFLDLVRDADVLVENFAPRVMPSLGLDYETLEAINPRLVMTSISNYGQTGPYRDYKASEITLYAMVARCTRQALTASRSSWA